MANYLDERQQALNQYQANNNPSFQDKTNTLINQMMQHTQAQPQQMNMPTPYQGFNPATSQSYQAAMNSATRNAQQASNNAMVQAGSKGIGNSSLLSDRMAQIQQQAMGRVSDTLLPQYEQMDYGRYRDAVGDQFKVNDTNYGRSQDQQRNANDLARFMSDLTQRQVDNSFKEADTTGYYKPPSVMDALNNVLNLKQQAGAPNVTSDQMGQFKNNADQVRDNLTRMGLDPNIVNQLVGFDVDYDQAVKNVANYQGTPTLRAQDQQFNQNQMQQDFAYKQIRDQTMDERDQRKFDEDVRQHGLNYAADQAYRNGTLSISQQNADTSRMNADRAAQESDLKQNKTKTADDYIKVIDDSRFISPEIFDDGYGKQTKTGKITVNDPRGLADYIFYLDLSEAETRKLFARYGLKWE